MSKIIKREQELKKKINIKSVSVEIKNLCKVYIKQKSTNLLNYAVKNFDLFIEPGELVIFLGPSGCGKTTVLRCIAGLEKLTEGDIYVDGKKINKLPPYERNLGLVFQNYALFPHLTVFNNLAYALNIKKSPKEKTKKEVKTIMKMLGLDGYENRLPRQLSGGEQQRVSLGRTLLSQPQILLLDEPLSNLDAKFREELKGEIRKLIKSLGITSIYVTHDQAEAMSVADKIVVMKDGCIEQIDKPSDIYKHPASEFVANFVGKANLIPAEVLSIDKTSVTINLFGRKINTKLKKAQNNIFKGNKVNIVMRPENVKISKDGKDEPITVKGKVDFVDYQGEMIKYKVKIFDGETLFVSEQNRANTTIIEEGANVNILLDLESIYVIPAINNV